MAKVNPVKLKQDADKEERAGRFDKAIALLSKLVAENPRDWATINRIGDLYGKLKNVKAANEQYAKVANFYAKDGFYLKAIAVWKKINRNDPALLEAHLNLGDLYGRQGLAAEAKASLGMAYKECVNRNRLRDAGDVLRQLAELDPSDLQVRSRLAELYAREGRKDKASEEFLALADELVKKGHRQEALQLLEKALKTGQRNAKLLSGIARVHLVQKDYERALPYLEEARKASQGDRDVSVSFAEALIGVERHDEAKTVIEGLLENDAEDIDAKQLLGRVFFATGQYDEAFGHLLPVVDRLVERAVALLQPITQQDPPHMPALGKLVELYRLSRNEAMVVQTYSQMVEAYLRREEMEQAASVLELLVQLEPHNDQHRSKLDWIRGQGVVPASPASLPAGADSPTTAVSGAAAGAPAGPGGIALSGPLSPEEQEFIDEHLSEGRVFRKYGLADKAREEFESALGRFPDNIDARRELVDLHKDRNEPDKAAEQLRTIAEIFLLKGDEAAAQEADNAAAELAPAAEAAPAADAPPPAEPVVAAPEAAAKAAAPLQAQAPAPAPPVEQEEELDIPLDVEPSVEDEPELELLEPIDEPLEPAEEPERPLFGEQDLAGAGELKGNFLEEPAPVAPPPAPDTPGDVFDLGDPVPPPAPGPDQSGALVPQAAPAAEPVSGVPEELQRVLGDVEEYVQLGFVEDTKEALAERGGRYDDHPALLGKLAELGLKAPAEGTAGTAPALEPPPAAPQDDSSPLSDLTAPPPQPVAQEEEEPLQLDEGFLEFTPAPKDGTSPVVPVEPAATPAAGGDGEGFDLANELGDLFGAQPAVAEETAPEGTALAGGGSDLGDEALTDLFREFQKGVDKQLGKEDYETRYNLGIAYKEMGLVDEAVAEFQLAAKDENRLLECASMLGICFIEKGMLKLAVKWFEKGLQAEGRTEQEYQGLRYDLADALEAGGDPARALEIFTELYGQDAGFRDVADKVRQLSARV